MYFPSYLYIVQRNDIITASHFLFWTYPRPHCCLAAPQYWHKTHCHWALSCCDWPTELRWQNAVLWLDWACLGCQRAPPPAAPASESAAPPPAAALHSTQDTQHSATQWPQAISTGVQCVEQCETSEPHPNVWHQSKYTQRAAMKWKLNDLRDVCMLCISNQNIFNKKTSI